MHKKSLLSWGLFAALVITFISLAMWQQRQDERAGKFPVVLQTLPSDAAVTIDDASYTQGTIYLAPGNYEATVSKDGFASYTQELIVNGTDDAKLFAGLAPASDDAKRWQQRHRRDYAELERQSFLFAQEYGAAFSERWPITNTLPIKDPYFTISYRVHEAGDITLTIKGTSPRYREAALDELRKRGFEPTEYNIEFIGFDNPLARGEA